MQFVDWVIKQTGKISDNFNQFKFYVKAEPQIIDSSSIVCVNTYISRQMTATVPCSFRWFKVRNNVCTEMPQFRGNTYICQPSDVGCSLQVQITSSDQQHHGTMTMSLGIVKFDILLRKQLEIALSNGETNYHLDLVQNNIMKQCYMKVSQDRISIAHMNSECSFTYQYSMIEPRIQVIPKSQIKLNIIFNVRYYQDLRKFLIILFGEENLNEQKLRNPYIELAFSNRKSKDSFIFVTKAFTTKKQLKSSSLIKKLQKIDFCQKQSFNYVYEIESLKSDILKLLDINSKNFMQKKTYIDQTKRLEKEIQDIISSYTKIIQEKFKGRQDFEKSFAVLKDKQYQIQHKRMYMQQQVNQNHHYEIHAQRTQHENGNNSPFLKKKTQNLPVNNPFQMILNNLNQSLRDDNNYLEDYEKRQLQNKLNNSLHRIQQLQNQVKHFEKINRSSINQYQNGQNSNSMKKQSLSQRNKTQYKYQENRISNKLSKVIQYGQKRQNIKQKSTNSHLQNMQAKTIINQSKSQVVLSSRNHINPQHQKQIQVNKEVSQILKQNSLLKSQLSQVKKSLQQKSNELVSLELKNKKKISQLRQQLQMYKRNNDVLNRSQHLSMEMEQYNQQEKQTIQNQNHFLINQNTKLQQLCNQYMIDAKRYKNIKQQINKRSIQGFQAL